MKTPTPRSLRRTATWTAPVVAAAAFIAAGPVGGLLTGAASAELPQRSAAQLLVDVQNANVDGFSGTVVEKASLGLPDLSGSLTGSGTGALGILTGTHTMRVWYAGPTQARVSLLSQSAESDVIRNGSDLWQWSSADQTARHWTLPADSTTHPKTPTPSTQLQLTPQQAADRALAAMSPTTVVKGDGTTSVAGRQAYVLSLTPRSSTTLVSSVRIAIDGKTHIPTQVQVFAKHASSPAISIGFSSFNPGTPPASVFAFNPPPGTTVTREKVPSTPAGPLTGPTGKQAHGTEPAKRAGDQPRIVGTGWDQVIVGTLPDDDTSTGGASSQLTQLTQLTQLIKQFPRVSGTWGSGYLFQGTLVSVVVTDDHRVAVGLVPPAQLYAALRSR